MQEIDLVKLIARTADNVEAWPTRNGFELLLPVAVPVVPEDRRIGAAGLCGTVDVRRARPPYHELTEPLVSAYRYTGPVERVHPEGWLYNRLMCGRASDLAIMRPRELRATDMKLEVLTDMGWRMLVVASVGRWCGGARGLQGLCWHQLYNGVYELEDAYVEAMSRWRDVGMVADSWRYLRGDIAEYAIVKLRMSHDDLPQVVSFSPKFGDLAAFTVRAVPWRLVNLDDVPPGLLEEMRGFEPGVDVATLLSRLADGGPRQVLVYRLLARRKTPKFIRMHYEGWDMPPLTVPEPPPPREEVPFTDLSGDDISNGTLVYDTPTGRVLWQEADGNRLAWLPDVTAVPASALPVIVYSLDASVDVATATDGSQIRLDLNHLEPPVTATAAAGPDTTHVHLRDVLALRDALQNVTEGDATLAGTPYAPGADGGRPAGAQGQPADTDALPFVQL